MILNIRQTIQNVETKIDRHTKKNYNCQSKNFSSTISVKLYLELRIFISTEYNNIHNTIILIKFF